MHHSYHQFTVWLYTHPQWGAIVAFLIALTECIPFLGTLIPGSVTMTVIGVLVGTGVMPITTTLIAAVLGAIAGDSIGLLLGYYYKQRIKTIWPFTRYPHWLTQGKHFIEKHGGKSIFLGRFIGVLRALVPMIAGMLHIAPLRFYLFDVLSAIAWAVAYMLPGYLLGIASLSVPPELATKVIFTILALLILIWLISWLVRITYQWLANYYNNTLDYLWLMLVRHRKNRRLQNLLRFPDAKGHIGQLPMACLFLLFCLGFIILWFNVTFHGYLTHWNTAIFHLFRGMRYREAMHLFIIVTTFGEKSVVLPIGLTLFVYLAWKKEWKTAWHWLALVALTTFSIEALKTFHYNPRPSGLFYQSKTSSFPSGHVTLAISLYGFIAYLLTIKWHDARKAIYWITTILCVAIIISRLYLCAHWLTDVIGAVFLGSALLSFFILSYRRYPIPKKLPAHGVLTVTLLTLFITSFWHFEKYYSTEIRGYRIMQPYHKIDMESWWRGKNHHARK